MSVGGAERQLVYLTRALRRRAIDVHVVTVFPGHFDAALAATGATLHRLPASGKYDPMLLPRMFRLLRHLQPDVIGTWLTQMDILAGLAAEAAGTPRVLCERNMAPAYPANALNFAREVVGARSQAVVANSEGGCDYWRPHMERARILYIPNIVAVEEIECATAGPDLDDESILYVGRFAPEKNLGPLIDALPIVFRRRPTAKVVFCGDGRLRSEVEQKVAALGIADRARFVGFVPDPWAWMKRAAVVVSTSAFEGNPNVVLEAMVCGAPLVVSDIPSHRALLSEESAVLVDPASPESIAAGLLAALDDRVAARTRAQRARNAVAWRSADEIAGQYVAVYERVIRRRS